MIKPYMSKLFSSLAICGVMGTAVTSAIATRKALEKIEEDGKDLERKDQIKLVAKYYILPGSVMSLTVIFIILSEHVNAKTIAGLSASFALLKKSYNKYAQAVKNVFGEEGEKLVRGERIYMEDKQLPENDTDRDVFWIGYGYDDYFLSTKDEVEMAEAELNKRLHKGQAVSVADVMDMLNLSPSNESIAMGWSKYELANENDEWIEFIFNTIDSDGDHPAQEIEFSTRPSTEFEEHFRWYQRGMPIDRTIPADDEPPFDPDPQPV